MGLLKADLLCSTNLSLIIAITSLSLGLVGGVGGPSQERAIGSMRTEWQIVESLLIGSSDQRI